MKPELSKMVKSLFPDAVPEVDFDIELLSDGTAIITTWNELKLGKNPGIRKIHELYMNYAKKKKELIPSFDAADPLPYLSAKKAFRSFELKQEPIEVFNGCTFQKRH